MAEPNAPAFRENSDYAAFALWPFLVVVQSKQLNQTFPLRCRGTCKLSLKEKPMLPDQHIYQLILLTENRAILTSLESYQYEILKKQGYRTQQDATPCETTQRNWVTHKIYIEAEPPKPKTDKHLKQLKLTLLEDDNPVDRNEDDESR